MMFTFAVIINVPTRAGQCSMYQMTLLLLLLCACVLVHVYHLQLPNLVSLMRPADVTTLAWAAAKRGQVDSAAFALMAQRAKELQVGVVHAWLGAGCTRCGLAAAGVHEDVKRLSAAARWWRSCPPDGLQSQGSRLCCCTQPWVADDVASSATTCCVTPQAAYWLTHHAVLCCAALRCAVYRISWPRTM
jgi:hypothetical protein